MSLSPKAFQLLTLLIEARPKALSRQELQDRLWPGIFVTHTSLPRVMNELREAMGDDAAKPRYIRTARGYGYAFKSEALLEEGPPPAASLVPYSLLWGGRQIPLPEGETVGARAAPSSARAPWKARCRSRTGTRSSSAPRSCSSARPGGAPRRARRGIDRASRDPRYGRSRARLTSSG